MQKVRGLVAAAAITVLSAMNANATVIVLFEEVGNNVVLTSSGSIDLTGLSSAHITGGAALIIPSFPVYFSGIGTYDAIPDAFSLNLPQMGTVFLTTFADEATGDNFGFGDTGHHASKQLLLPRFYTSGAPINATSTFLNQIFTSLELDETPRVLSLINGDTVEIQYAESTAAVPLPLSGALLATGIAGLAARRFFS